MSSISADGRISFEGSPSAALAVEWAIREVAVRGSSLRVGSSALRPTCFDRRCVDDLQEQRPLWLLRELRDQHPSLVVELTAIHDGWGDLIDEAGGADLLVLAALLDNIDPDDLVVVGASSHEGAAAFWLGSSPRHLVRHSPCPVVVVRGAASRGRPDRVVVGIDGSPASERALQWAGDEADRHHVSLLVVHGWMYTYLEVGPTSSQARDLTNVDAACLLDRAVESAREQFGAEIAGQLVESGPATALLETVHDGDLLVVGSRGRGALEAGLFGSTVNTVLDRCAVPVVVVRGADEAE